MNETEVDVDGLDAELFQQIVAREQGMIGEDLSAWPIDIVTESDEEEVENEDE